MWPFSCNESKYLPYRMNRMEKRMAAFDDALASLSAKVEAILSVVNLSNEALAAAREAVVVAEARADRIVAEDAAEDAALDAERAAALAAVTEKLDSVLNPVVEDGVDVADAPLEPVVADDEGDTTQA